eukprot:7775420-Pyramimonas_sp.AAC.1
MRLTVSGIQHARAAWTLVYGQRFAALPVSPELGTACTDFAKQNCDTRRLPNEDDGDKLASKDEKDALCAPNL